MTRIFFKSDDELDDFVNCHLNGGSFCPCSDKDPCKTDVFYDTELDRWVLKSTGSHVAIKSVQRSSVEAREQLLKEIDAMKNWEKHANLLLCYGYHSSTRSDKIYMLLELMDLGNLKDLMERIVQNGGMGLPPQMLASITRQIMTGLEQLHGRGMVHGDLKPENILHNSAGEVKLSDFGVTRSLDERCWKIKSCVTYMSPECATGEGYSFPSDIWSAGMVVYELASGHHAFSDVGDFAALYEALCENPEPRLDHSKFPAELCDFVASCLIREVHIRSSARASCCHPFANSEFLQVLTINIELLPAQTRCLLTCCDLGGTEQFNINLETDTSLAKLECHLREKFPGFRKLLGEDGTCLPAGQLVKDSGPRLTFTIAGAALVQYLASLLPSSTLES